MPFPNKHGYLPPRSPGDRISVDMAAAYEKYAYLGDLDWNDLKSDILKHPAFETFQHQIDVAVTGYSPRMPHAKHVHPLTPEEFDIRCAGKSHSSPSADKLKKQKAAYLGHAEALLKRSEELSQNVSQTIDCVCPSIRTEVIDVKCKEMYSSLHDLLQRRLKEALKSPDKKRRENLPKKAKDIWWGWIERNMHHPYPTDQEKLELAAQAGVTVRQVTNWFINARGREWRPKLEKMQTMENAAAMCKEMSHSSPFKVLF